jgi:hypothetical protein
MPRPEGDKAAEKHVDSWGREGKDGRWTRIHRSARRALFTPFKVAGGPNIKIPMKKIRITRGKFFDGGKTFKIIDDWTVRANAHRMLESSWIGTTDFRESADYIDDDTDEEIEKKDEDPVKEEPTKESETKSTAEESEVQNATEYFELSPAKTEASDAAPSDGFYSTAPKTAAGAKDTRSPPADFQQGRPEAPASRIFETRSPSFTSRPRVSEGECQTHCVDSLFLDFQTGQGQTGVQTARATAARSQSSLLGKVAARCFSETPRDIKCAW